MSQPLEATEQLSADEQRRLLAEMLQKKASRAVERPLSFGQERLWLMARLDPDSFLYNIAVAYHLERSPRPDGTRAGRPAHRGTPRRAAGHVSGRDRATGATRRARRPRRCSAVRRARKSPAPPDERMAHEPRRAWRSKRRNGRSTSTHGPLWRVKVFRDSD